MSRLVLLAVFCLSLTASADTPNRFEPEVETPNPEDLLLCSPEVLESSPSQDAEARSQTEQSSLDEESSYSACCKVCKKGCPCGDSCISCSKSCHKGPGCAC